MSSERRLNTDPIDVHAEVVWPRASTGDLSRIGRRLTEIAVELTATRRGPGLAPCGRASWSHARPLTLLLDVKSGEIIACNLQFGRGAWWALSELVEEVGRIARAAIDPRAPRERGWMTQRENRTALACFAATFDDPCGCPALVLVTVVEEPLGIGDTARLLVDTRLPMWAVDRRTLRLLDVNDAVVSVYGYSRARLLGMRLTDLVADPASVPELLTSFAEWSGADDLRWEGNHRCSGGDLAQVELLMRASEHAGTPIAFVLGRVCPGASGTWSTMRMA